MIIILPCHVELVCVAAPVSNPFNKAWRPKILIGSHNGMFAQWRAVSCIRKCFPTLTLTRVIHFHFIHWPGYQLMLPLSGSQCVVRNSIKYQRFANTKNKTSTIFILFIQFFHTTVTATIPIP